MSNLSCDPSSEQAELTRVSRKGTKMTKGAIIFLALVIAFSLVASGYALYDRFASADERRTAQEFFNERIRQVSFDYCTEIESLKKANRDRALEAYRNLDQTLVLLELERTTAIVERAKGDRDRALRRFAADPCPRPNPVPVHPLPRG